MGAHSAAASSLDDVCVAGSIQHQCFIVQVRRGAERVRARFRRYAAIRSSSNEADLPDPRRILGRSGKAVAGTPILPTHRLLGARELVTFFTAAVRLNTDA